MNQNYLLVFPPPKKSFPKTLDSITLCVNKAIESSHIDATIQQHLIPHNPQTPEIYGQPKIHKPGIPIWPIVTAIGALTHMLCQLLMTKLKKNLGYTPLLHQLFY